MSSPGRAQIAPTHEPNTSFSPPLRRSSRRTASSSSSLPPSLSSYSSLRSPSCYDNDTTPLFSSPITPLPSSGIPFSWEKLPGIPKKQLSNKKNDVDPSLHLLPLPPSKKLSLLHQKKHTGDCESLISRDPFLAALVECSKEDHQNPIGNLWKDSRRVTRTLSDRFGFVMSINASCKRTCAVSESIIYLPPRPRTYGRSG